MTHHALTLTEAIVCTQRVVAPFDPICRFLAAPSVWRFLWLQPTEGLHIVAYGIADMLPTWPTGDRARAIQEALAAIQVALPGLPLNGPLLIGGRSFDPTSSGTAGTAPWENFPPGLLVLPKHLAIGTQEQAWELTITGQLPIEHAWSVSPQTDVSTRANTNQMLSFAAWTQLIARAQAAMRAGILEKVVLARAVVERPTVTLEHTLRWLTAAYPTCTICALGWGDAFFLSATPERLVRVQGQHIETMALAGSAPRGTTPADDAAKAAALLASAKDRHEHQLVVEAIRDELAPLCRELTISPAPSVLTMPNVQHLATPISGTLNSTATIFDLVDRLHPTPAVGGQPRAAALAFLRANEPIARGWYAGTLGWIDARGSGDFVVTLRSALLRGGVAWLYAGCGIVAASQPDSEWEETELKLRPMRAALGVLADER
ncbi:isochorismate synthase [Thermorudis peleae]|uniref:isochorismate synthase n=1 Tax=Thermorudis peleae TaxID=1382356 RepID=UPI00068B7041|nr:isochorismate synthase [Thermorudis peleae]